MKPGRMLALVSTFILILAMSMSAFAATGTATCEEDSDVSVSVTSDKDSYVTGDTVNLTIGVTNNSSTYNVNSISLQATANGTRLSIGTESEFAGVNIGEGTAEGTYTIELTESVFGAASGSSGSDGSGSNVVIYVVIAIVAVVIIVAAVVLVMMKKKKAKAGAAMIMLVAMAGFSMALMQVQPVSAEVDYGLSTDDKVSVTTVAVHDPSIFVDIAEDGTETYYVFGTQRGVAKSTDLMNWTSVTTELYGIVGDDGTVTTTSDHEAVFSTSTYDGTVTVLSSDGTEIEVDFTSFTEDGNFDAYAWAAAYGTNGSDMTLFTDWSSSYDIDGNMWAPDIYYNEDNGTYYIYWSLNGPAWNSVIVLCTSDNLLGPYTYAGPVVYSGFVADTDAPTSYKNTDLELVYGELDELQDKYSGMVNVKNANQAVTASESVKVPLTLTINGEEQTVNVVVTVGFEGEEGESVYVVNTNNSGTWGDNWPHAIDPCVVEDEETGELWLSYGSWSGGIYMIKLDKETGLRDYTYTYEDNELYADQITDDYFGVRIAGGNYITGEGSYIQKIGDYYYLWISYGFYDPTGGYNMRIYRSECITGPYTDLNGNTGVVTTWSNYYNVSRGIRLFGPYKWSMMSTAEVAQGHNSAFVDTDGKAYVIYHIKYTDGSYSHQVRVHQLVTTKGGWIVAAPFKYSGETVDYDNPTLTADDLTGEWGVIIHTLAVDYENYDYKTEESVTFNADGTITGAYEGTWTMDEDGKSYMTIVIDDVTYDCVFFSQNCEGYDVETAVFTGLGDNQITIWGAKVPD
ncbi:MAG: glycoside hydrolase family 43 protein [Lachnospiraceae bacterium]|nr:glycoside hydrolase family 43 protein [Lachnospiraceae bacterium]